MTHPCADCRFFETGIIKNVQYELFGFEEKVGKVLIPICIRSKTLHGDSGNSPYITVMRCNDFREKDETFL